MKKLIITCALLSATSVLSFAQSANSGSNAPRANSATSSSSSRVSPEQVAQRRSASFQKNLGLSEDQTKKVYQVELDYATQNQAMRANNAQPGEGQVMQLGMGRDQRLQQIMTPDQYAKYETMKPKTGARPNNGQTSTPASRN